MKKYSLKLILLCSLITLLLVGCKSGAKKDSAENSSNDVDYSMYNFAEVQWTRDAECDVETLSFLANGEFRYSCACGNPVNDSDVVESYSYDDTTKMFTLICCEEVDGMITNIQLISCDGEKLELDFNGEVRVFFVDSNVDENEE